MIRAVVSALVRSGDLLVQQCACDALSNLARLTLTLTLTLTPTLILTLTLT